MHSLWTVLCSHPILALLGFSKPFCIESDESGTAIGGVLTQKHASVYKPIAFFRKILTSSKHNCSIYEHKLLAIVACCTD